MSDLRVFVQYFIHFKYSSILYQNITLITETHLIYISMESRSMCMCLADATCTSFHKIHSVTHEDGFAQINDFVHFYIFVKTSWVLTMHYTRKLSIYCSIENIKVYSMKTPLLSILAHRIFQSIPPKRSEGLMQNPACL